ncbi:DeoR family transcriptional regulator [Desmospora profundinema]|uniref:DeoR/GlpR family transcriptional regulator of sugar metabolism n=1 Tax=Desmospora profundinema TaxID=1571184 RepID=A0ABU1IMG9_9BACL|nr:DeoR family transcriptional regulator [Desmospora profundinema]MDR6225976.1 DeoR/GlpR family transcriptional regulator of sugar metabolism [Desmospora profundinema]
MLPHERQERIRQLIRRHGNMKISELSKELDVSEMTVYRDIQPLVEEGLVQKVYGGITLVQGNAVSYAPSQSHGCVLCSRQIDLRLAYRLILSDNRVETACCSHCGLLRHQQAEGQVAQAVCQDFITNTTISARLAWFVMGSEVDVRCCKPQVLNFERLEDAKRFVRGFAEEVLSFEEALNRVQREMEGHSCCSTGQE